MANTQGLLARLTRFCFWPIEGQWRASVSMLGHNVSQKQHGWKERPPQRLSITEGTACMCILRARTQTHRHHDAWVRVMICNLAKYNDGDEAQKKYTCGCANAQSVLLNPSQTTAYYTTSLHYTDLTHINTQPLLHFSTMRSNTLAHIDARTHTHTPPLHLWDNTRHRKHTHTHTLIQYQTHITHSQKRWWTRRGVSGAPLHL